MAVPITTSSPAASTQYSKVLPIMPLASLKMVA